MAQETVIFEIRATAKGVKVVKKQTDDLAKSSDKATRSTKNLSKSRDQYNRREKGAAGISSNATKNFSKMQQSVDGGGGGGLVRAYALLAANVFALSAAFGVLSRSAQVDTLIESMQILSTTGGQNIENLSRKMQKASGGAIDLAQSFRQVSLASSAGLSTDEIEGLTQVAKGAAISLGRDLPDAMDRIFRGAIKLEPEILDEIGLFVRVDEASQKYADHIGKAASTLTQYEKRQGFLNEILDQGREKFQEYADTIEPDPYVQLAAAFFDLAQGATSFINAGLGPVIKFLTNNPNLLATAFASLVVFLMSKAIPALGVFNMNAAAGAAAALSDEREYLEAIKNTMSGKENAAKADVVRRQEALALSRKQQIADDKAGKGVYNVGGTKGAADQSATLKKLNRKDASDASRKDALDARIHQLTISRNKAKKQSTKDQIDAEIKLRNKQQEELRQSIALKKELASIPETGGPDKGSLADRRMGKLEGKAASSAMIGQATGIAETKGLKAGWDDLRKSTKAGNIEIDGSKKSLGKMSKGMVLAKGSVSLLGVGFQKLMMMMGPIMMIFAMLTPVMIGLAKAIGFNSKEAKIFDESLKTLSTQLEDVDLRLNKQSQSLNDASKSFIEANKAAIAYMKTIQETNQGMIDAEEAQTNYRSQASGIVKALDDLKNADQKSSFMTKTFAFLFPKMALITAWLDSSAEKLQELTSEGSRATLSGAAKSGDDESLAIFRENMDPKQIEPFNAALLTLRVTTQDLADGQGKYNKVLEENRRIGFVVRQGAKTDITFAKAMNKEFGIGWEATTALTKAERKILKVRFDQNRAIRDADKKLKDLNFTSEQSVVIAESQNKALKTREELTAAMNSAMIGTKDSVNSFNKALMTKTSMDSMVSSIDQVVGAFDELGDKAQEQFFKKFDDKDFFLNQIIDDNTIALLRQGGEVGEKTLKKIQKEYHEIQRAIIMNKGEQKMLSKQVKLYNKTLKVSTVLIDDAVKGATKQKKLSLDMNLITRQQSAMSLKMDFSKRKQSDALLVNLYRQGKTMTMLTGLKDEGLNIDLTQKELIEETLRALQTEVAIREHAVALATESQQAHVKALDVRKAAFDIEHKIRDEKQKAVKLDEQIANMKMSGSFAEQTSMQKATMEIQVAQFAYQQTILKSDIEMRVIAAKYALMDAEMRALSKQKGSGISSGDADDYSKDLKDLQELHQTSFNVLVDNAEKGVKIAMMRAVKTAFGSSGDIVGGLLVGGNLGNNITAGLLERIKSIKEEAALDPGLGAGEFALTTGAGMTAGMTPLDKKNMKKSQDQNVPFVSQPRLAIPTSGTLAGEGTQELAQLEAQLVASTKRSDMFRMSLMNLGTTLKGLGPGGEMVSAFASGGLSIINTLDTMKQNTADLKTMYDDPENGLTEAQRKTGIEGGTTALRLQAAAGIIGAIGGMMAANSKAQIAEIDGQIAAEKRRDGKSKESLAKIASMEKKKETMKRKAFDQDKKMKMAQTIMSTASAMMAAASAFPGLPYTMPNVQMAAMMGAVQLAVISQMKYTGGAASIPKPPSMSMDIGSRNNKVDVSRGANAGELTYARGGKGSGSGMGSFTGSGAAGYKSYAAGGSILVGERGPEIVTPTAPIEVTPNDKMGSRAQNINFSINAVDSAGVEDLLINQRGNIIRMIREAANDTGERFLETVDTQAYGSNS